MMNEESTVYTTPGLINFPMLIKTFTPQMNKMIVMY